MAIDHDLFSLVDLEVTTWPAVIVTNPKAAILISPFEPLYRMQNV
jgi:hypothetical protein